MKGDAIMNNYYNIVTKILEIAKKHIFIKEAHYGDIYEFHNSGNRNYSTFVLTQGENNQINENYTQYNFTAFVTDRLTDDEKNLLEVQSNCATILNQIMIEIQDKLEYFSESETMSFWKEKFNDLCAGCFIQFSLQVPNDYICNNDIFMTKSLTITENGLYNVTGYDSVDVNVHPTDVFNYFTLYPSNYIYANYLDLSTEIVSNVKFTGDEDFYFCSDEKGLIGLYFDAEENETYAWWDSDRIALHFHKRDWDKGFYKIQFKAGRLQIGYLTWTLNSKSSTTSFDPLYFGYMSEKTSPMEIEYITISNQYGAAYDYRPKITDEYAELVEVISGKIADIRTVYSASELRLIDVIKNGGKLGYSLFSTFPYDTNIFSKLQDTSHMFDSCSKLSEIDFSKTDMSDVIEADNMFNGCSKLSEIDFSKYGMNSLKSASNMFNGCRSLIKLDFGKSDMSELLSAYCFMQNCEKLEKIDLSGWKQYNIRSNSGFGDFCYSLKSAIGDHTLEEVENGQVVYREGLGKSTTDGGIYFSSKNLRWSSVLAALKGAYDRTGMPTGKFWISYPNEWKNDDDTLPPESVRKERYAQLVMICNEKNYTPAGIIDITI